MNPSQFQTMGMTTLEWVLGVLMRLSIATAVSLVIVGTSVADHATAAIDKKATNIQAQDLGSALQELAQEHDIQIVYLSDSVDKVRTSGAAGELGVDEALKKLLRGTGLSFRYPERVNDFGTPGVMRLVCERWLRIHLSVG
jgi:hypothetical protein